MYVMYMDNFSSPLKSILYGIFASFDDLGLNPSSMASVLATYVSDKTEATAAVESLEEASAYLQKEESIA